LHSDALHSRALHGLLLDRSDHRARPLLPVLLAGDAGDVGFDSKGKNQIDFADGVNQLWTFNAQTKAFTNTGGFTKLFTTGQDAAGNNEIWFTDGNNQVWRLDQGQFIQTTGFALSITGSAGGQMYFSDGINQIWIQTDAGVFTNTGGFASHISSSPGTTALFFSGGISSGNSTAACSRIRGASPRSSRRSETSLRIVSTAIPRRLNHREDAGADRRR
jgi:hypothetical protein